ncbi:hypothetical protein BCR34DRAFT_597141 [Clohesyomyces aquaticus]|uniref:Uncharacterized protein n=1 Tax=Clohesyomyces aquaticus TaxID=1231657 RepID=A0A1Y2A3H1_9PLEO|nr:hypothetical protein BCR34DRAFT_597141 [Clohesyomyces aquaticus]
MPRNCNPNQQPPWSKYWTQDTGQNPIGFQYVQASRHHWITDSVVKGRNLAAEESSKRTVRQIKAEQPEMGERKTYGLIQSLFYYFCHRRDAARAGFVEQLKDAYKRALNEITSLKSVINHLRETIRQLNEELKKITRENARYKSDLTQYQVSSFRELRQSSWVLLEDQFISRELDHAHKEIDSWARKYGAGDFEKFRSCNSEAVMKMLMNVTFVDGELSLEGHINIWLKTGGSPRKLLSAVLTNAIYTEFLGSPFLAVNALDDDQRNTAQAEDWRLKHMRSILSPPRAGDKLEVIDLHPDRMRTGCLELYLSQYCGESVASILQFYGCLTDKAAFSGPAKSELVATWRKAARILVQIQAHRSRIQWESPEMLGRPFDDTNMKPHRSQSGVDPTSARDVRQVSLVMSPFLFIKGDESGDEPEAIRPLLPAVVIVYDPSEVSDS